MRTTISIAHMSREEKLRAIETLWADLSKDESSVESPAWHEQALRETRARSAIGSETRTDWEKAKKDLRKRRA